MQQMDEINKRKPGSMGFVGAGKAGFTLGKYFAEHGAQLSGYYSRNTSSASAAARFTESREYGQIKELVADSDILFLTVPDGSIKTVWDEIKVCGEDLSGKLLCHASGSLSSEIFEGADERGVDTLSLHPLFAISDKYHSFEQLHRTVFTIEGSSGKWQNVMEEFIRDCGNKVERIDAEYKPLYHTAAVVASNFLVGLSYLSSSLLKCCGFSAEGAEQALLALMAGSMDNVIAQGAVAALTGPVERNDCDTVRKHLQALAELERNSGQKQILDAEHAMQVYRSMTALLMEVGSVKHKDADYGPMRDVMEQSVSRHGK